MKRETIRLPGAAPGLSAELTVLRYGMPGARPCVHIQAGLHADEVPGMLAAHRLLPELERLEAQGRVRGEVVILPLANPIGLGQRLLGRQEGRFDIADGLNFNRGYSLLTQAAADILDGRLGDDPAINSGLVRVALRQALTGIAAATPVAALKKALLGLALEADIALDLHCDGEAAVHIYTHPGCLGTIEPLARLLAAEALLVAEISGGDPFDEALTRPWADIAARFPAHPVPFGCAAATVELRGKADVAHEIAARDADALLGYLAYLGALDIVPPQLPKARASPTPLEAAEALEAPHAGILVYRAEIGARVAAGTPIADIVDPSIPVSTTVAAGSDGVFFARAATRFVAAGQRIGKIAGTALKRSGALLSP
jgi:predicted deacylase